MNIKKKLENNTIDLKADTLDNLHKTINKWLYLKDERTIDVLLALYVANLIPGDPVWLFYVSPPGGTKTALLQAMKNKETIEVSNVTENTFLSGKITNSKKDPSLIKKIEREHKKMLFMKDFTSVMSQRKESMAIILAQLREIYDGDITKSYGTGKTITWKGKLGFIAGVTNVIDAHYGIMNSLGGRFIQWRPEHNRRKERAKAIENSGSETQQRKELGRSTEQILNELRKKISNKNIYNQISDNIDNIFVGDVAEYTAVLRTHVNRDYRTMEIKNYPHPEIATRLGKNFKQFLIGLMMVRNKFEVTEQERDLLRKVARDTVPEKRNKIIKILYESNESIKTSDVASKINIPTRTARYCLEDVTALGFIKRTSGGGQGKADLWGLSNECRKIINDTNLLKKNDQ